MHSNPSTPATFQSSDGSDIILRTEEDNRLCRIAHGDYGDNVDKENETAPSTAENEGEVSLPMRLLGASLSERRTTGFVLRLTFSVTCVPSSIVIGLSSDYFLVSCN